MKRLRSQINYHLSKYPRLYRWILQTRGGANIDKLVFLSLIHRGDIVLDVGANEGYYSILFSHLVGEKGVVHSFEPVPRTFEVLSETVAANAVFSNVVLQPMAVGDGAVKEAAIYVPGDCSGQASFKPHQDGAWSDAVAVTKHQTKVTSIDEYVQANRLSTIDFVKVDVEGYELMCVRGAARTLTDMSPVLYLEVCDLWSKDFGYEPNDLIDLVRSYGYDTFYLVTDRVRLCRDSELKLGAGQSANVICGKSKNAGTRFKSLAALE